MKKMVEKVVGGIYYVWGATCAIAVGTFYSIPMAVKTIKTAVRLAQDEGCHDRGYEIVNRATTVVVEEYSDKMDKVLGLK